MYSAAETLQEPNHTSDLRKKKKKSQTILVCKSTSMHTKAAYLAKCLMPSVESRYKCLDFSDVVKHITEISQPITLYLV